jgi:hypothetical protein
MLRSVLQGKGCQQSIGKVDVLLFIAIQGMDQQIAIDNLKAVGMHEVSQRFCDP